MVLKPTRTKPRGVPRCPWGCCAARGAAQQAKQAWGQMGTEWGQHGDRKESRVAQTPYSCIRGHFFSAFGATACGGYEPPELRVAALERRYDLGAMPPPQTSADHRQSRTSPRGSLGEAQLLPGFGPVTRRATSSTPYCCMCWAELVFNVYR